MGPRLLSYPDYVVVKDLPILLLWWVYLDSNQGPRPYQGRTLTN